MIYYAYKFCENNYRSQHETGIELRTRLFSALNITDDIEISENGRPCIKCSDVDFSVSHSKNMAVCAVIYSKAIPVSSDIHTIEAAGSKIGADTEFIDPAADIMRLNKIANRYLNTEIASRDEFYINWTRHESFGKMCGEGIFYKSDDRYCSYFTLTSAIGKDKYLITICIK